MTGDGHAATVAAARGRSTGLVDHPHPRAAHMTESNITFHHGDLFKSGADALVNPVNCVGVMGAGLAKQFKQRDRAMFDTYATYCRAGLLRPGAPKAYLLTDPKVIWFPTKDHWRDPSQLQWIDEGLEALRALLPAWGLKTVAIPPLGCGLGGLPWPTVRELIVRHLSDIPSRILVYGSAEQGPARAH